MSTYVTTGLAILGIALGSAGLYVGLSGRNQEGAQNDRLSELEQRMDRLNGASEELNGQIRGLYNQTRTSLQEVSTQMTQLREDLANKSALAPPLPAATAAATAPSESGRTYTIRAGDLLGKVAKDHGTSVDAILKVNSGLNPNRLKVGQVINLP